MKMRDQIAAQWLMTFSLHVKGHCFLTKKDSHSQNYIWDNCTYFVEILVVFALLIGVGFSSKGWLTIGV